MQSDNTSRLAYGIRQACDANGLSRSFIYQEIATHHLLIFKVGSRTLITAEDLAAWIDAYRERSRAKTRE